MEYEGVGRTLFSSGKVIYPGRKQVVRCVDNGAFAGDTIGKPDEKLNNEPLLVPVMKSGQRLSTHDFTLEAARRRARQQIDAIPPQLRLLGDADWSNPVDISPGIAADLQRLRRAQQ